MGLKLLHLHLHGLIRSKNLELGRDSDTGGQTLYVLELVKELASCLEVDKIDLVTRLIQDRRVSSDYSVPIEPICQGATIKRLPFGPKRYVRKELLWPYLDDLADHLVNELKQHKFPDWIHAHYADAGYVGALVSSRLGLPFVFTGHSLGREKKRRLLAFGMDHDQIQNNYSISRRIEAEEFADDVERKKNIVESEKRQVENKKARVLSERQKAQKLLNQANQQLEKLDKEHADLEKLEDAIQADIDRLMSVGGVAPGKLSWPITGSYVSSGYKWRRLGGTTSFHGAIDIPSSTGTPIKAAAGGVVIVARYYGAAGRTVFIDHGGGMTTLYFHMNRIYVSVGQTVVTGDVIGSVGTTGRTTGPHLHFEVRLKNPSSVNCSRPYLDPTSRGRMNPYCFLDG